MRTIAFATTTVLVLSAVPVLADTLQSLLEAAHQRCEDDRSSGKNELICVQAPGPMTVEEAITWLDYNSAGGFTLEDMLELNEIPTGLLTADMPVPETMFVIRGPKE